MSRIYFVIITFSIYTFYHHKHKQQLNTIIINLHHQHHRTHNNNIAHQQKNTIKLAEVKIAADARETEKSMEKRHVFANKLYIAEMNREKELQKKLDICRKHVRSHFFVYKATARFIRVTPLDLTHPLRPQPMESL